MAKKVDIGLRQGRKLCQMSQEDRLSFIAQGLPILLASSQGFQEAATRLSDRPREADVLVSFADEEAAKILILLDIIRCPPAQVNQHVGKLMHWFYDHLTRLLYAKATNWKPANIGKLQNYITQECEEHSLEGFAGEYILPSGPVYERESALYADIETYDNGELAWHEPRSRQTLFGSNEANALKVVSAMQRLGMLNLDGLRVMAGTWGASRFLSEETPSTAKALTHKMFEQMGAKELQPNVVDNADLMTIHGQWQLPMYELEITPTVKTIKELREMQASMLNDEIGSW